MYYSLDLFRVNRENGMLTMEAGVEAKVHNLKVEVRDNRATAVGTVVVNVIELSEETVKNSGSLRIPGNVTVPLFILNLSCNECLLNLAMLCLQLVMNRLISLQLSVSVN